MSRVEIHAPAVADVAGEIDDARKAWKRLDNMETVAAELPRERLAMGRRLVNLRRLWPARGPKAKGWGEALAKIGISQQTAYNYMTLAGYSEEVSQTVCENPDRDIKPEKVPTYAEAGIDKRPRAVKSDEPAPVAVLEPSAVQPKASLSGDVVDSVPWVEELTRLSSEFQRHASALFSVGERMEQIARANQAHVGVHRLSHIKSTVLAARSSLAETLRILGGTNV